FKERKNKLSCKLRVLGEPAVLPTCHTFVGAYPKHSIARGEQFHRHTGREMLIWWWLPGNVPDSVEAQQAKLRGQPEITVGSLGYGADSAFGKPVADLPRRVCVLTDVQRRI